LSVPRGRIKAMVDLLTDRQAWALEVILETMLRQAGKIPPGKGAEGEPEEGCAAPGKAALPAQAEVVLRDES
jgi:hypothetical protein